MGVCRPGNRDARAIAIGVYRRLGFGEDTTKTAGGIIGQRRDGRELFFLSTDRQIMAVAVRPETEIGLGSPAALFRPPTSYSSLG